MKGLGRLAAAPGRCTTAAAAQTIFSSHSYSTFSAGGDGGGCGRGRGRGSGSRFPPPSRVPGQTQPNPEDDSILGSFPSWNTAPPPPATGRGRALSPPPVATGRGRGHPLQPLPPTESPDPNSKKPIFFRREEPSLTPSSYPDLPTPRPSRFTSVLPGAGRGQPARPSDPAPEPIQENRHLRRRPAVVPVARGDGPEQRNSLRGGPGPSEGRGGRGRGGRGMVRGRGRGRGRGQRDTGDEGPGLFLGDNADGERLEKMLGEENMKKLTEEFEEMSYRALPSLLDDAYLDALHTNNMIEYEPEYLVDFDNPDIDEKPPMPLEEVLQKIKPFVIAYEGMQSQEEWEEAIKDLMERLPHMKKLIDMYCGPDRVTAKQQQQELERLAKTLPENIPSSVKRFTDRAVLSLQSNPGWGWDKKYQFMDKLVMEVSKHYNQ